MAYLHLAVLGDPIDHSRSPAIHSAALGMAGISGEYTAVRADRARLETAVAQLRDGTLDGMNVTMPLKQDAWDLAERTTREASRARSINTMRCKDGVVEGHSTDAVAFRESFESDLFESSAPVLVLGAGGSARAALATIGGRTACLSARNEQKASTLADEFGANVVPWATPIAGALVVNTTPLGMHGESIPEGILDTAVGLIDLPYGEEQTPAVSRAGTGGIPAVDGFEFLARGAAASFQWWTGVAVDSKRLAEVARNA